jgi:hypothetical protein
MALNYSRNLRIRLVVIGSLFGFAGLLQPTITAVAATISVASPTLQSAIVAAVDWNPMRRLFSLPTFTNALSAYLKGRAPPPSRFASRFGDLPTDQQPWQ